MTMYATFIAKKALAKRLVRSGQKLALLLAALTLTACIQSTAPILADAKPVFGESVRLHLYSLYDGGAHKPEVVTFRWNGSRYVIPRWQLSDLAGFTVHDFEGSDAIVQSFSAKGERAVEYALAHKLADGTFLINAIEENDVDEATRAAHCSKTKFAACRIETREQLFAFARATAAKGHARGGLAVVVSRR
jgi:hypothetical protein